MGSAMRNGTARKRMHSSHGFAVTAPVAVPEILCSQFAHRISTAATPFCSLTLPQAALANVPPYLQGEPFFGAVQCRKGPLAKGAGILLCKMTGGFLQCVAKHSCQCLRRPDFFCLAQKKPGKENAAKGTLFDRVPFAILPATTRRRNCGSPSWTSRLERLFDAASPKASPLGQRGGGSRKRPGGDAIQ